MKKQWYVDSYTPNSQIHWRVKKLLFSKKTKFQDIEIFDLFDLGKSLVTDGIPQSCSKEEWIYHEALIHPALILHPKKKNLEVLVLGAGEGATLREILKHKNIKKITTVDIDRDAVEIFKKFFPEMHKRAFRHPKVDLIFDSAERFLKKSDKKYDVIYSDISDPGYYNLSSQIRRPETYFYKLIRKNLSKDGILAMHTNNFSEILYKDHFRLKRILEKVFQKTYSYRAHISFFGGYWGFLIASPQKNFNPFKISDKSLYQLFKQKGISGKLKYLSPEMFKAIFTLPPFLKRF